MLPNQPNNVEGIADMYGYKSIKHKIETKDGYILNMIQIKSKANGKLPRSAPAVLLQHGMANFCIKYI